jgi:hypothetical protein
MAVSRIVCDLSLYGQGQGYVGDIYGGDSSLSGRSTRTRTFENCQKLERMYVCTCDKCRINSEKAAVEVVVTGEGKIDHGLSTCASLCLLL